MNSINMEEMNSMNMEDIGVEYGKRGCGEVMGEKARREEKRARKEERREAKQAKREAKQAKREAKQAKRETKQAKREAKQVRKEEAKQARKEASGVSLEFEGLAAFMEGVGGVGQRMEAARVNKNPGEMYDLVSEDPGEALQYFREMPKLLEGKNLCGFVVRMLGDITAINFLRGVEFPEKCKGFELEVEEKRGQLRLGFGYKWWKECKFKIGWDAREMWFERSRKTGGRYRRPDGSEKGEKRKICDTIVDIPSKTWLNASPRELRGLFVQGFAKRCTPPGEHAQEDISGVGELAEDISGERAVDDEEGALLEEDGEVLEDIGADFAAGNGANDEASVDFLPKDPDEWRQFMDLVAASED